MTTVRRAIAVAVVSAGLAVFGGAASAHAQDADEQFEEAVSALGITTGPETDVPGLGRQVCDTMTHEMARNPNPPPVVRGIVNSLMNSNLTKKQAVGFLQASVTTYCPQFSRYLGR
ncbi:DUF732 domain-containing protein [Mycobacterium sp. NPDC051804]|uniref:DUF732 domain-containing protein n=1 Tax=Mycobacterium sp. NPDC051804 TaxID=3364295 RepID=UPI0037B08478